jgi:hypothetical protein
MEQALRPVSSTQVSMRYDTAVKSKRIRFRFRRWRSSRGSLQLDQYTNKIDEWSQARVGGTYSQQDLDPTRFGGHWVAYKYKYWLPLEVSLLSGVRATIDAIAAG